jgi:hypothetical protein
LGERGDGTLQQLLLAAGGAEPGLGLLVFKHREREPDVVLFLGPRDARVCCEGVRSVPVQQ